MSSLPPVAQTPAISFWENAYNTTTTTLGKGVTWIKTNGQAALQSASTTLGKVWAATADFFSRVATKLSHYYIIAKGATVAGLTMARDYIAGMPKDYQILGSLAAVVAAVTAFALCSKKDTTPAVVVTPVPVTTTAPVEQVTVPVTAASI